MSRQILEQPMYLCVSFCFNVQSASHKSINSPSRVRRNNSEATIENIIYDRHQLHARL